MKIQIASLEALERLIGNDNQIELELRNSIVQDFTKKHLKALATDGLITKIGNSIKNDFEKELFESSDKRYQINYSNMVLSKRGQELVDVRIKTEIEAAINKQIEERISIYELDKKIKEKLDYAMMLIVDKLTERNLEQRLNRMVDERLKSAMGIKS